MAMTNKSASSRGRPTPASCFGVWNTDDKEGLRLLVDRGRHRLQGRKILASGAGFIERPLSPRRMKRGAG